MHIGNTCTTGSSIAIVPVFPVLNSPSQFELQAHFQNLSLSAEDYRQMPGHFCITSLFSLDILLRCDDSYTAHDDDPLGRCCGLSPH